MKAEKWVEEKAPRVISPRSPEYLLCTGAYIAPLEKRLYRAVAGVVGHESIMKGFSLGDRGSVLNSHWQSFKKPYAVGLDASKFDQHVSVPALQFEHGFYLGCYGGCAELKSLLDKQLVNRIECRCEDGVVRWVTKGSRMSGDTNTASGNCLISAAMLYSWAKHAGVEIRAVVDGDDCVAIMEEEDVPRFLNGLQLWYRHRGFRMRVENQTGYFEKLVFCQSQPVWTGERWVMVRNPVKAITQDHAWIARGGITHLEILQATGEGGVALYGNIPVLGAYYRMLRGRGKLSKRAKREMHNEACWLRHFKGDYVKDHVVSTEARVSFCLAFGILPSEQKRYEEYFSTFDLAGALTRLLGTTHQEQRAHLTNILRFHSTLLSCRLGQWYFLPLE